jgi:hypothetical protein
MWESGNRAIFHLQLAIGNEPAMGDRQFEIAVPFPISNCHIEDYPIARFPHCQ